MYYVECNKNSEIVGVHYNQNYDNVEDINTRPEIQAKKIDKETFDDIKNKKLTLKKWKLEGDNIVENARII